MQHWLRLFVAILILSGCGTHVPHPTSSNVAALAHTLEKLGKDIPHKEAVHLSQDIYTKTGQLAKEFGMVSPPQYHNFLVTVGLKQKGLCYHWSDALYEHLKIQGYAHFDFHLIGANIGQYWNEHNALVVVPRGCISDACILKNGIVIDGWRNAGELYFSFIPNDKSYYWHHRHSRCYGGE